MAFNIIHNHELKGITMKYSVSFLIAIFMFATLPALSQQARLQVIHNAADPGAAVVDIYVNGAILLDDFAFRAATPFTDVPAGVDLEIGVAPGSSTGAGDIIATFTVNLDDGKSYIAVANGVLDPMAFAANPDMKNIGFTLLSTGMARESAMDMAEVDLTVLHGATDAPAVDVIARGVGTLVNDAAYGDITPYFSVPAGSYTLDVTPAMDNATIVASFTADLSGLAGGAAIVFASGFLSPMDNQNGEAFGLYAALPDGTVVNLSPVTSVRGESAPLPVQALSAYPNPSREQTTLRFAVERDAAVSLRIFDLTGREVYAADRGQLSPGLYDAAINTAALTPGVYRVLLSTTAGVSSTTLSVVR